MSKALSAKVPEVVLTFWIIKIAATTLGETGGDTLSMTFAWGYAASSLLFLVLFLGFVAAQIRARKFHPWLYWATIVATTLVGTTIADFADRSLGIGYFGGASVLYALVLLSLAAWRFTTGSISVANITSPRDESFYWLTILTSNTLGTALGDMVSDGLNFGFSGGAIFFAATLAVVVALYKFTKLSHAILFWAAFVLTRPLGATLGDLLTKPLAHGGFNLSRPDSSALIALFIAACIALLPQRAGGHPA